MEEKKPTDETLQKLLELLILKEKKNEAAAKVASDYVQATRDRGHYFLNPFWQAVQAYNRIQKCTHLKGARGFRTGPWRDYNISLHTFPTGESRIRCLWNCGFEVWNRPGWSFKWAYGMKMVENSTNWPSSSQISPEMLKGKTAVNVRTDVVGGSRVIYQDKDPV